jgi:hypothetical protein
MTLKFRSSYLQVSNVLFPSITPVTKVIVATNSVFVKALRNTQSFHWKIRSLTSIKNR